MTTHLHFDCFSGVSGDMLLGACVDVGVPLPALTRGLASLRLPGVDLRARTVRRGALRATKVDVVIRKGMATALSVKEISARIAASRLPPAVKARGQEVFALLARAESRVHGVPLARVHFHEVGVIDSFVDVMGSLLGCHLLDATRVTVSPINVGSGFEQSSHGALPVPAPAVAQLAEGIPIYSDGPRRELATPTGMAVLRVLGNAFCGLPPMRPTVVGYGAGDANPDGWANVLRLFVGQAEAPREARTESVFEIETNLDDLNPQAYELVMERLFAAGALDVTIAPVVMKRGRPGIVLTALAPKERTRVVADVILRETTALGVRFRETERMILPRSFQQVLVRGLPIAMKVAEDRQGGVRAVPEYADCRRVAEQTRMPVRTIMEEAVVAYHARTASAKTPSVRRASSKTSSDASPAARSRRVRPVPIHRHGPRTS